MSPLAEGSPKPRVCAVSFLNTVPLVWGMLHGPQRDHVNLEFRLPSACAARMSAGEADVGLVPSIEAARQGLEIIPGCGIACRGAVRSILLVTRVAPERIRTLASDTSSRSSAMLARIILAKRYGAEPTVVEMAPQLPLMLAAADAALLIGDPALRLRPEHLPAMTLDLGAEWWEMTGLPMVFAVWASRKDNARLPGLAEILAGSSRYGLERVEEIVKREAGPRNVPEALAREYLKERIVLDLGDCEYEGMRLFLQYASEFDTVVSSGGATA